MTDRLFPCHCLFRAAETVAWLLLLAAMATPTIGGEPVVLRSPSGDYRFELELQDFGGEHGCPCYQVTWKGRAIVADARLGLRMEDGWNLTRNFTSLAAVPVREVNDTWKPVYGERAVVRDHYLTTTVALAREDGAPYRLALEIRCYDQGVAFCYHVAPDDPAAEFVIDDEHTEFAFTEDHTTWTAERAQHGYTKTTVAGMSQAKRDFDRPQLFRSPDGKVTIAVAEARLVDYGRLRLHGLPGKPHTIVGSPEGPVRYTGSLKTPWRVIMVAEGVAPLLAANDLILNLNDPCALRDTSWIKPGKVIREVTLSTEGGLACIDFAKAHGLQYVHFDAGWYGPEWDETSDATTVTVDRQRSKLDIDMPRVLKYAESQGIGIFVYVNRHALEKQLDTILPLYEKWGIKGVKYGFVRVGPQESTIWLHEAVRKAARHHLMVDIHDEYRPTGYSRTYPNLLTQEGIGGDETRPSPAKTLGILFPRYLAGAADNTICYFDPRVDELMNHSFQLAKAVCLYSPLQFLYWYDRPLSAPRREGGAGGAMRVISDEPELAFFAQAPTVWDDTRILAGRMEQYAVIARRSGETWFLGAMNAEPPRTLPVPLDFLSPGVDYTLESYTHDPDLATRTHVRIARRAVRRGDALTITLSANDGAAYRIRPRD